MFDSFLQDLRIGLRVLIKEKGFCALAAAVLALGIGAVTTQFSIVNGVVIRGFAFPHAERLATIQFIDPTPQPANFFGNQPNQILSLDFQELAANQKSFERVAAYIFQSTVNVSYNENPQRYTGAYVTEDFFRVLGIAPVLGRDFTTADNTPGAAKVALISHRVWQRDFAASPNIHGTAIRINGKPATIIGVMPPNFAFPINEEIWIPLFNEFPPRPRHERGAPGSSPAVLGLLRPDVTAEQATEEISSYARRFAEQFPESNKQFNTGYIEPLIKTFTPRQVQNLLFAMLALCFGVLLLACANVMNMQFARATLRAKELAVRSSLGASRSRLIRQMLTESLLLASIGATLGIGFAFWATDFLHHTIRALPNPIPAHITFDIDVRVLGFVVGAAVLSAIFSGVLPAWMASKANPVDVLKEGGRGNTGRAVGLITRGLVVAQLLLTCVILIASLLQLQSILRLQKVDYGYDTRSLMSARMGLMDGSYPTPAARGQFHERLLRELRASSEIEHAALTSRTRMAFAGNTAIEIERRDYKENRDRPTVQFEQVSDGFFPTLGIRVLEGRDFNADDVDTKQPVAIINAGFAKKQFGNESPLGRRFRTVVNNGQTFGPWRTIIGVVSDVRMLGPFNNPNSEEYGFYVPLATALFGPARAPQPPQFATIIVKPRSQANVAAFANNLRQLVRRVDPDLPLYFVATPAENIDGFLGQNRVIALMFSVFGVVATILAAVGLYGVMSFAVNQRTQEFGIRMALGADTHRILRMVLRQGAMQLGLGLILGLGLALGIGFFGADAIGRQLNNTITPTDPLTYIAVAVLLTLVALIATLVPARRATRVDPMIALRAE
jgi:predicted permease